MKYWVAGISLVGVAFVYFALSFSTEVVWMQASGENESSLRLREQCEIELPNRAEKRRFLAVLSGFGARLPVRILVQRCVSPVGVVRRSGPEGYLLYLVEWPWVLEESGISMRRTMHCKSFKVIRCKEMGRYARFKSGQTVSISETVTSEELFALSSYLDRDLTPGESIINVRTTKRSGNDNTKSGYQVLTRRDELGYRAISITNSCIDGMDGCETASKALDIAIN